MPTCAETPPSDVTQTTEPERCALPVLHLAPVLAGDEICRDRMACDCRVARRTLPPETYIDRGFPGQSSSTEPAQAKAPSFDIDATLERFETLFIEAERADRYAGDGLDPHERLKFRALIQAIAEQVCGAVPVQR